MYLNQYYHFSPNHTHNTCSSCLASSFLLPSSIPSSSFLIHLPIPLTLLWQLSRQHQRCLGKDMKGHAPVQAECQEGNVQDGCQREAEVADDLTNCLCLRPVRVRLAEFCTYVYRCKDKSKTQILSCHQSQLGWILQRRSQRSKQSKIKILYFGSE